MESRKSLLHKKLESSLQNSPTSSSPLRKSINVQKLTLSALTENDDEAERIARRREMCTSTPLSTNLTNNRRHSLGLGFLANIPAPQMAESISQCIKLSAENKINIRNAFSLEMIDFMTYMIKKQDANMSNLQMASASLDVSTKIYGFRVDSVHTDILKMIGGLDKQVSNEQASEEKEDAPLDDTEGNTEVQKKKKKKKAKQKICSTVEALRSNIEIIKPTSMMIGEGDLQTSDMLYQAILPNHANSGFYQHPYNDVIVDVVENRSDLGSNSKYSIPAIEDFSDLEICMSYSKFEFLGWSVQDEPEEMPAVEDECDDDDDNQFQFNLDASVEHDNESPEPEPMNYFDIAHDDYDVNIQAFQKMTNRAENFVDAQDTIKATSRLTSEYSFVQPNMSLHWAGPSHWKFRNFSRSATASTTGMKVIGACMQAPLRKRREILLSYDDVNRDMIDQKFAQSQSNKLQAKTAKAEWNAENLTLPEDVHYDIVQISKYLYLYSKLAIKSVSEGKKDSDIAVADVSDGERYDYNNPNDTLEYCPDVNNDDAGRDDYNDDCNFEDENAAASANALISQGFTGDNMVAAPKLANKISIAYCLKAKKIDMRQLKKSIWTCLKCKDTNVIDIREAVKEAETNTIQENMQFSNVYKRLPKLLSKANAEALSVPISFISLLHLANEKDLKIHSLPDMSDVIVEAN